MMAHAGKMRVRMMREKEDRGISDPGGGQEEAALVVR